MVIFISGGSKSGKSALGEKFSKILHKDGRLIYLATMKPMGNEDLKRIENHKKDRLGTAFEAFEINYNIEKAKEFVRKEDTVLLDSVTSLMANEMFKGELLINEEEVIKRVDRKIVLGIEELKKHTKNLIIISDYIFSEGIIYDKVTENYRRELGYINKSLSKISDVSIYVSYGLMEVFKGEGILKNEKLI